MSMTREEAIKFAEHAVSMTDIQEVKEFYRMSAAALRPVSRERVEKVWSGCEACKNAGLAIGEVQFYGPFEGSIDVSGNMQYCPNCGRPITPAAQERQLERLEALKDGKGD